MSPRPEVYSWMLACVGRRVGGDQFSWARDHTSIGIAIFITIAGMPIRIHPTTRLYSVGYYAARYRIQFERLPVD